MAVTFLTFQVQARYASKAVSCAFAGTLTLIMANVLIFADVLLNSAHTTGGSYTVIWSPFAILMEIITIGIEAYTIHFLLKTGNRLSVARVPAVARTQQLHALPQYALPAVIFVGMSLGTIVFSLLILSLAMIGAGIKIMSTVVPPFALAFCANLEGVPALLFAILVWGLAISNRSSFLQSKERISPSG